MEHLLPLPVEYFLMFAMFVLWTIVYLLVIYKGFKDQSCGMPLACICANITWEFLFTFIMPVNPLLQAATFIWFVLDCIILLQFFYYSKGLYSKRIRYASVFSLLVIALLLQYGLSVEFNDQWGIYSAFAINLLMSILFIRMLLTKDLQGQSLSIAYFKMIGTLCASILCYSLYPHSVLLMIMYILIFILDVVYIALIYHKSIKTVQKPSLTS